MEAHTEAVGEGFLDDSVLKDKCGSNTVREG